jgi:serine/threonine protein phosphatase 1
VVSLTIWGRCLNISTYVISDIHGEYDKFMELLDKIKLRETDTLYILGDILDRGPHPIKTLLKLMDMPMPSASLATTSLWL